MSYATQQKNGYFLIQNADGKTLGMSDLRIKEADGFAFKNLSGTETLLPYEDWRLPNEVRAEDLAQRLSLEQIAGLMLWSPHQLVPFVPGLPFKGHYDGGDFLPGITDPAALTDEQKKFVSEENLRKLQPGGIISCRRWRNSPPMAFRCAFPPIPGMLPARRPRNLPEREKMFPGGRRDWASPPPLIRSW